MEPVTKSGLGPVRHHPMHNLLSLLLRILTAGATLAAIIVMLKSTQTVATPVVHCRERGGVGIHSFGRPAGVLVAVHPVRSPQLPPHRLAHLLRRLCVARGFDVCRTLADCSMLDTRGLLLIRLLRVLNGRVSCHIWDEHESCCAKASCLFCGQLQSGHPNQSCSCSLCASTPSRHPCLVSESEGGKYQSGYRV